jgi:hypothetical protein
MRGLPLETEGIRNQKATSASWNLHQAKEGRAAFHPKNKATSLRCWDALAASAR